MIIPTKSLIKKVKKLLADPTVIPLIFIPKHLLSDRNFIRYKYLRRNGLKLNLNKPVSFNDKLHWLNLYYRIDENRSLVDKYQVRKFIAQTIGEEYLIPIYGAWEKFDDIPFKDLPNEFVLKCNHDSGSTTICKDKKSFDFEKARIFFNKRMEKDFYTNKREYYYKGIKPLIMAQKLIIDESGLYLKDYKIFCFNGVPKIVEVDLDLRNVHKRSFFTTQWEFMPVKNEKPNASLELMPKPENLETMLNLARQLSASKCFVRTDFFSAYGKIYFGELTFLHCAGYSLFDPPEWNTILGEWLTLPCLNT